MNEIIQRIGDIANMTVGELLRGLWRLLLALWDLIVEIARNIAERI